MHMQTDTQWVALIIAIAVLLIAAIALFAWRTTRQRHVELKRRFGPEYEREVQRFGSVARAERELHERERRVRKQLRPLRQADRAQFAADWRNVQARFVDDPSGAVESADALIHAVMVARGYETVPFEQRVADLTVEHASVVQHYRAAHELATAQREGRADTEELRQAVVHYRALFADLLEQPQLPGQPMQEAHV
jgi:hypothetical protein